MVIFRLRSRFLILPLLVLAVGCKKDKPPEVAAPEVPAPSFRDAAPAKTVASPPPADAAPKHPPNALVAQAMRGPLAQADLCKERMSCVTKELAKPPAKSPFETFATVEFDNVDSDRVTELAIKIGDQWYTVELYWDTTFGRSQSTSSIDVIDIATIGSRNAVYVETSSETEHQAHDDEDEDSWSSSKRVFICAVGESAAPSCVSRESNDRSESHELVSGVLVVDKKATKEASAESTKRPLIFP